MPIVSGAGIIPAFDLNRDRIGRIALYNKSCGKPGHGDIASQILLRAALSGVYKHIAILIDTKAGLAAIVFII